MKVWLSPLVALHVLAHSLLGCCWHHGHSPTAMVGGKVTCSHHDHGHADPTDEPSEPGSNEPLGECKGGPCVFATAGAKVCPEIVNLAGAPLLHVPAWCGYNAGITFPFASPLHELGPPDVPLSGRSQTLRI